jgi:LemA protein
MVHVQIIVAVAVLLLIFFVWTFNRMITLKNRVENAWSQIGVQLKKRADLVPNLIETVRGYAKHEMELFTEVTKARSALMTEHTRGHVKEIAKANDILSSALKTLFAVAENYPKLKANENFKLLQEQLEGLENKIAYSRQYYNDSVQDYETARESFPTNIIANVFGFKEKEYFEVSETESGPIKIKF